MSPPAEPVHLDGTILEGGGQILRLALSLSTLTKTAIHIDNIRGKRSGGGGLKAQHLTCVTWLGRASNAKVTGAELRSKEITFTPNTSYDSTFFQAKHLDIKQSTPGSVSLVFQAVLPFLLFSGAPAPITLTITGGTNVSASPSHDYILQVLVPMLTKLGIPRITADLHARGWSLGSAELGSVTYNITPLRQRLAAFQLTNRGVVQSVRATVIAPAEMDQRFREELDREWRRIGGRMTTVGTNVEFTMTFEPSPHTKRYYVLLVATTTTGMKMGRDWLYDRGFKAAKLDILVPTMVKKVFDGLLREIDHGGCVDEYLRDQLVVFQALADGRSRVDGGKAELSTHALTAQWVAEQILGVRFLEDGSCQGVGFGPGGGVDQAHDDGTPVEEMARLHVREEQGGA